ncbi:MAG TPA: hypothetical protein VK508_08320 [Cyclobacteriaceae bacterium]|nr:hypothetical protein [Cyclobacteriaceae bacterium]
MQLDTTRLLSGHPKDEQLPPVPGSGAQSGWTLFSPGLTAVKTLGNIIRRKPYARSNRYR